VKKTLAPAPAREVQLRTQIIRRTEGNSGQIQEVRGDIRPDRAPVHQPMGDLPLILLDLEIIAAAERMPEIELIAQQPDA
jgi:hypothetical protein